MRQSDNINELATAFAKAQGQIENAKKDTANPFFKSKYADLASVWDACRGPLSSNGLAVPQFPRLVHETDDHWLVEIETILLHASGQFMSDVLRVPVSKLDAQGVGSAISYAKRYALQSIVGVAPEEDDGESAVGRGNGHTTHAPPTRKPAAKPAPEHLPPGERKPNGEDPIDRAKENAKAFNERTPDQIYADAKSAIKNATLARIPGIRAAAQGYADEGKLTPDHTTMLFTLIDNKEAELEAAAAAGA